MSEKAPEKLSIEQRLARAVGNVPGVARLEPSLARAMKRLAQTEAAAEDSPDGVTLTRGDETVDVTVEISVTGPPTALDTAVAVREAVLIELSRASLTPAAVSVRVLAVEPDPDGDDAPDAAPDQVGDASRET